MNVLFIIIIVCMSLTVLGASMLYGFTVIRLAKIIAKEDIDTDTKKRIHPNNSKVDFSSSLKGRKDVYSKYKNKDGLYEPQIGKNGIELKQEE